MTLQLSDFRFVAKALPNKGQRPRELARTMLAALGVSVRSGDPLNWMREI